MQHLAFHPDVTVQDVVDSLDAITGGRVLGTGDEPAPWSMIKDSGIPGKSVMERPGLVWGRPEKVVHKLAVAMTLTEHHIELASATGVDAIVAHHPVADAASSGGVTLRDYLSLYDLAVLECHEAFHGLHPGIAHLHGHRPFASFPAYGGVHGLVIMVGRPLPGVETLGDVFRRLDHLLERSTDRQLLAAEREIRQCGDLRDSATGTGFSILHGQPDTPLGPAVLHAFPHTGFDVAALSSLLDEFPDVRTLILSISSATAKHPVVLEAAARGLNVLVGTTHASEILENGLPLGFALADLLPDVEVQLFRDRVVGIPLERVGTGPLGAYGTDMARGHLLSRVSPNRVPVSPQGGRK